ncbi:MAG TPA: hypothetical protein VFD32_04350 [Dehalococcoidia bacterium]|nr:hypothetical protein [Dehalococcoidia bacterium]
MHPRRLLFALLLAGALPAFSCGGGATQRPAAPSAAQVSVSPTAPLASTPAASTAGGRLFVRVASSPAGRIDVLDAASGAVVRELPDGVLSPDGETLFTVDSSGTQSVVRAIATDSGATLHEQALAGGYRLPVVELDGTPGGLSPNGRWLALVAAATDSYSAQQSDLAVLDARFATPLRLVHLAGSFTFDALSDDGASLFLIERTHPEQTGSLDYRVRRYDLAAGALDPTVVVEKGGPEEMRGLRLTAVAAPGGDALYSLYTNGADGAFVHALSLSGRFAVCIDLPNPPAPTPAAGSEAQEDLRLAWSLALTTDGRTLYAANSASGQIVVIDLNQYSVRRSAMLSLAPRRPDGPLAQLVHWLAPVRAQAKQVMHGGAALSADGGTLYVAGAGGVLAVDTGTLRVRGRLLAGRPIAGLRLSADGSVLYALPAGDRNEIAVLDLPAGRTLTPLRLDAQPQRIWAVR